MTEQSISLERMEETISVFGSFDENIRLIEAELGVSVVNRDAQLKITGEDPEKVMYAARVIENLMTLASRGESIGEQNVRYVLQLVREGREEVRELTEDDLVFVTNGSCTENSSLGSNDRAPEFLTEPVGGCWQLWRNIAAQDPAFGRPDKYCTKPGLTNWESATVTTLDDKIPPYLEKVCKRDPFSGKVVTGGIPSTASPTSRPSQRGSWWGGSTACSPMSPGTM